MLNVEIGGSRMNTSDWTSWGMKFFLGSWGDLNYPQRALFGAFSNHVHGNGAT
jgi:hypothetical protein